MARITIGRRVRGGSVYRRFDEPNAESSQGRRRSNVINHVPHDPSKRTMITLDGGRFTATVILMIIYIFKNKFNGSWTTWNEVNRFARDELWALSKAFFQWEVVSDVLVREVWEDSMRKLYPGLMSMAKGESIKMAQLAGVEFNGSDFSVLKPYNPEWIESSYRKDMIDRVWNTKSKLWKHHGGSIAISQLKRRLVRCLIFTFSVFTFS
ncbi:Transposon, En/Spm-like protein [Artemisia annua]|uniref:Transposon, En/Spm-like protein n=1 Tax=Artemisia annua TaxID=35608 RepID=A0A2U1PVT9_ARTAN|nr:Transposon, En/Spm-like protein [Artemisia annua]